MSEISLKSPHLKQRELDYVKVIATITVGDGVTEAIDISGLSIDTVIAKGFSVQGFEAEAGVALDSSRRGGISVLGYGTKGAGLTLLEAEEIHPESVLISGATAGERSIDVLFASTNLDFTATNNSLTDAVIELVLPIKAKDF